MFSVVTSVFKFLTKHLTVFLVGGIILAIIYGWHQNKKAQQALREVKKQKNNITALTDSVRTYRNKAGELTARKLALQTDKEQLKELNEGLSEELQKERDKVEQITEIGTVITGDTTIVDTIITSPVSEGQYRIDWSKSDSGDGWSKQLGGYVTYSPDSTGAPTQSSGKITKDRLNLKLITGITEKNGQREIFVRSTYPYLRITQLDGAVLMDNDFDRRRNRWSIGPNLSYSIDSQGNLLPTVGIGIQYSIFSF